MAFHIVDYITGVHNTHLVKRSYTFMLGIAVQTKTLGPFVIVGGVPTSQIPLVGTSIEVTRPSAPILPSEPEIGALKLPYRSLG